MERMIGIISDADVEAVMAIGLNYRRGLLGQAEWLGVEDCHESPVQIRPSPAMTVE